MMLHNELENAFNKIKEKIYIHNIIKFHLFRQRSSANFPIILLNIYDRLTWDKLH